MLTGAGLSTASGLPDFRSAASGVWEIFDPERLADISALERCPGEVWDFYAWRLGMVADVAPNAAHHAIHELERAGAIAGVATQNVDGLHAAAGTDALELHGSLRTAQCRTCRDEIPMADALASRTLGEPACCATCGGVLKPGVVMFGEMLPVEPWHRAKRLMDASRLVLVVGSSLAVSPANRLPWRNDEARVVICTRELVPGIPPVDVWSDAPVEELLPALVDALAA